MINPFRLLADDLGRPARRFARRAVSRWIRAGGGQMLVADSAGMDHFISGIAER